MSTVPLIESASIPFECDLFSDPPEAFMETLCFLEKLPEYRDLKEKIGSISIQITETSFTARVNLTAKKIFLNPSLFKSTTGKVYHLAIDAILFEMCNLEQEGKFKEVVNQSNKLTPDEFVEKIEQIEFQSVLSAGQILRKTQPKENWKFYPTATVFTNFKLNYLMQQITGHSHAIWKSYAYLFNKNASYKGNWTPPLLADEKKHVMALLFFIDFEKDSDPALAAEKERRYLSLKKQILARSKEDNLYSRLVLRIKFIEDIFFASL